MQRPYRLAQIGYGRWGKILAQALDVYSKENNLLKLEWIHTRSPIPDPRYIPNIEQIWKESPDGIIIATPLVDRGKYIVQALENNTPILAEKPFSVSRREGYPIYKIAKQRGVPILINYVHFFSSNIDYIEKEIVHNNTLKKIQYIRMVMAQPGGRYPKEGVETLLLSHLLYITKKLFPNHEFHWIQEFSTYDENKKMVATQWRGEGEFFIHLYCDLSYPKKLRTIEIVGELGSYYAEFGGEGKLLSCIRQVGSMDSKIEESINPQDQNLNHVFKTFFQLIQLHKEGKISNENYDDLTQLKTALWVDEIIEKIKK